MSMKNYTIWDWPWGDIVAVVAGFAFTTLILAGTFWLVSGTLHWFWS